MKTLTKKACGLLHQAEEMLSRPGGWYQGWYRGHTGKNADKVGYCLLGGIFTCAGESYSAEPFAHSKASMDAVVALAGELGYEGRSFREAINTVIEFNDASKTRKKDVIEALRKTREAVGC